ncbi:hypothetical protein M0812_25428 [Anaeramoeba flamelloides]|uniref:VHS domain-containing protein n=1 Tax=Anaeramoeba flamelloides TaxID=1746091 RepID=A0AAV7YEC2_9EUKA|nr:hypothetical protein M0812_25428 [Anaeramoeba flamelloides]
MARLSKKDQKIRYFSLQLLDASVKHVDDLSLFVDDEKFLNFLNKKLVTTKRSQETDYILIMIRSWAKNYASMNILSLYNQLKKKGNHFFLLKHKNQHNQNKLIEASPYHRNFNEKKSFFVLSGFFASPANKKERHTSRR